MRFRRVGARKFLRLERPEHADMMLMGDCGAFSYSEMDAPPYTPADTVEFYADGRFTHGCSIDHIIFEFDPTAHRMDGGSEKARLRFDITLELAGKVSARQSRPRQWLYPYGCCPGLVTQQHGRGCPPIVGDGYR